MSKATIGFIDAMGKLFIKEGEEGTYNNELNNDYGMCSAGDWQSPASPYPAPNGYVNFPPTGYAVQDPQGGLNMGQVNRRLNEQIVTTGHTLIPNRLINTMLYTKFNSEGNYSKSMSICNFCIIDARKIISHNPTGSVTYIKIDMVDGKSIIIDVKKYFNQKNILNAFNSKGFAFYHSNKDRMAQLILDYIASLLSSRKEEHIPYTSGWCYISDGKNAYRINYNKELCQLNTPFTENWLFVEGNNDPVYCMRFFLNLYAEVFEDQAVRTLFLGILVYAILYSRFLTELQIKLNKFILLTCDEESSSILNQLVNMFLKLYVDKSYLSINNTKQNLDKCIVSFKDEPLLIDARQANNCTDYQLKANLIRLKDILFGNNCIQFGDNKYNLQAPIVFLDSDLEYRLGYNEYIQIQVSNINSEALLTDFNSKKAIYSAALLGYIKYLETLNSNSFDIAKVKTDVAADSYEFDHISYKIFTSALKTLFNYATGLGIDFNREFGIHDDMETILYNYFATVNYADTISDLFKLTLQKLVKNNQLFVVSRDMVNESNIDTVLIREKKQKQMWLTANAITNIVIPAMNIDITLIKLLKTLYNEGLLYTYCQNYRVKKTIDLYGKSVQKYFIILLIDFNEIDDTDKNNMNIPSNAAKEGIYWDF